MPTVALKEHRTTNAATKARRNPAARRPTLSAAVITLNETHQIRELVDSLSFADEIVLVDGGSHDGTARLGRELGCRVIEHPFDDFASQRNRAIDHCQGDWILSIDADERPSAALAVEMHECINGHDDCQAYRIPIRSRIFGRRFRFSGTQDDRPVRLFARNSARWFGDVHERLRLVGRVGQMQGCLNHRTLPDLASFLRKMDRYTTLEANDRLSAGCRPRCRDRWLAPAVEFGRRFLWKGGMLDGPEGWIFCLLSGFSKWVEADKHRRLWRSAQHPQSPLSIAQEKCEPVAGAVHRIPTSLLPLLVESSPHK